MEFGAQQCILVRNEAARDKLRKEVGDIGLIMPVSFSFQINIILTIHVQDPV
jgi:hypothetical protein